MKRRKRCKIGEIGGLEEQDVLAQVMWIPDRQPILWSNGSQFSRWKRNWWKVLIYRSNHPHQPLVGYILENLQNTRYAGSVLKPQCLGLGEAIISKGSTKSGWRLTMEKGSAGGSLPCWGEIVNLTFYNKQKSLGKRTKT